ncbi:MAG TPA: hypothetical protein DCZ43_01295 [candidate division Zixibacteria bacterium]|nr:hypothetical protein [candidate division Zixibacteria bacterium]
MILELNYFYKIGLFRGFVGAQFIVPIKVIKNYRDVKLFLFTGGPANFVFWNLTKNTGWELAPDGLLAASCLPTDQ